MSEPVVLSTTEQVVLVVDVIESVRLINADEAGVVARWLAFMDRVESEILPARHGRLVKSTGDGFLATFASPRLAVQAAAALHACIDTSNRGQPIQRHMRLRAGIHMARVYVGVHDVYGAGTNLAARLATLAGPGETVMSAHVRDCLVDGLDACLEDLGSNALQVADDFSLADLGECFMKHLPEATRVYRVGKAGPRPVLPPLSAYTAPMRPTIAIMPFQARSHDSGYYAIGDLIADGLIVGLSMARHFRVISRLSSSPFRDRATSVADIESHLNVTHVLTGSHAGTHERQLVSFELCDVRGHEVVLADRIVCSVDDLLQSRSEVLAGIVGAVHDAVFRLEVHRVQTQPLPTLQSYSLLLGAIQLLHRSSRRDVAAGFDVLDHLIHTHPRLAEPRIWKAKGYALRAVQGLTADRAADARDALACTSYALDVEPGNAFALAMLGFVHCHLTLDYDAAIEALAQSVALNPSETLGHLFMGVMQGVLGDFAGGISSFEHAAATSPLDPALYMIQSIGAYLNLGAGRHQQAIALAQESLRHNREHAHSWRILTIAQVESGQIEQARETLRHLMLVQPDLSVERYLGGRASADDKTRRRFAQGLLAAGCPQH